MVFHSEGHRENTAAGPWPMIRNAEDYREVMDGATIADKPAV